MDYGDKAHKNGLSPLLVIIGPAVMTASPEAEPDTT